MNSIHAETVGVILKRFMRAIPDTNRRNFEERISVYYFKESGYRVKGTSEDDGTAIKIIIAFGFLKQLSIFFHKGL